MAILNNICITLGVLEKLVRTSLLLCTIWYIVIMGECIWECMYIMYIMYIPYLLGSQMVEIMQFEVPEPVSQVHIPQELPRERVSV